MVSTQILCEDKQDPTEGAGREKKLLRIPVMQLRLII